MWKIDDQEFYIKTIIDNVGLLWIRGSTEEFPMFKMPNVIIETSSWQRLVAQPSTFRNILLANFKINEKNVEWESIKGNHYRNTFLEKSTDDYHTPEYLLNITSIILCVILLILIRAYIFSTRRRYSVYELLGMTRKRLNMLFLSEFLWFNTLIFLTSIILSLFITSLFLSVALQKIYILDWDYFSGYFFKYIVMYGITLAICLLLFTSSVSEKSIRYKFLHKKISVDLKNIKLSLNVALFSMLIVFLVGNLFLNFEAINAGILGVNATGKIVNDSDYEFMFIPPLEKQGEYYYDGNYHNNSQKTADEKYRIQYMKSSGELDNIQTQLLKIFPNAHLESYVNLSEVYLVNKDNLFQQEYLQKLYRTKIIQDRAFWNKLLNQSEDLLLIKVIAYPDDKIKMLSKNFSGNLQSVLEGDSAYLVAPSYQYFESFDSVNNITYRESKPIDKNNPNAIYDYKIKENDVLTIISLDAKNSMYGTVDIQSAKKVLNIKHINVAVGGISYKQVGWLDLSDIIAPYRLIVSKNFLEKNSFDKFTTRLRVKIPDLDYQKDDRIIRQIVANYPNVKIVDQYGQLQTFRQYSFIQQSFKILLIVIFFVLTTVIFNSLIQTHIFEQKQKYLIYGLLGMSRNRLFKSLSIPVLCNMIFSIVGVSMLELYLFFGRINILSFNDWVSLFIYIVLPMIICIFIILMLIYWHIKKFMNSI